MVKDELFIETFEVMECSEYLIVSGGTLPDPNSSEEIQLNLGSFIPIKNIINWSRGNKESADKYPIRDNPLDFKYDNITVSLERGDGKFRYEPEEMQIRLGKQIGSIGGKIIDVILVVSPESGHYCFVGKPYQG